MKPYTKKERECVKCGEKFLGGSTAKYCYECKDKLRDIRVGKKTR